MGSKSPPDIGIKTTYNYNKDTGDFTHIATGKVTTASHSEGYHRVQYNGVRYFVHKLAYWWETGDYTTKVDHKDRDSGNNIFTNLRPCDDLSNAKNKGPTVGSYKGVAYYKRNEKWGASITSDGVRKFLGLYSCEKEAALAYNYEAEKLHGEFAYYNKVFEDVSQEMLRREYGA